MHLLTIILLYGLSLSILLSALILAMIRVNPRLMLQDYPKDIQAAVPPKTPTEKRQTLYWSLPVWLLMLGVPAIAALSAKAAAFDFLGLFLAAFGAFFFANLVDWLILDWLIMCTITPKFAIIPGTAGMAGYKNYAMHFRGFLIGTGISIALGLIIAGVVLVI